MSDHHQLSLLENPSPELSLPRPRLNSFVRRILSVTYMLDKSGSMEGKKITALNCAMGEVGAELRNRANTTFAGLTVQVQVIAFESDARCLFSEPVSLDQWHHLPLTADGGTSFAAAFEAWEEQLRGLGSKLALAPCGILLSDGHSPDSEPAFQKLMCNPRAKLSVRGAVAVGKDADRETLSSFLSPGQVLHEVDDPAGIVDAIIVATMASIAQSMAPKTQQNIELRGEPSPQTMPSLIDGGLTEEQKEAMRAAGIDPDNLVS